MSNTGAWEMLGGRVGVLGDDVYRYIMNYLKRYWGVCGGLCGLCVHVCGLTVHV